MVPLWSLTSTLIPAGRFCLLFIACSERSILCTYMLDLRRVCEFHNALKIDLLLTTFGLSVFLRSMLLPHVIFPFISLLSCQLHGAPIAVYDALFRSN